MQKMSFQILFRATKYGIAGMLAGILLLGIAGCASKKEVTPPEEKEKVRVVAYLMSHDKTWLASMDTLGWQGITDLNLAFLNPEPDGRFPDDPDYTALVAKAKQASVEVFFSIGGGAPPDHLAALLTAAHRDALIESIVAFADKYDFDGVDVDLENALINENYAPFVSGLGAAMKKAGRKMTAALASWNAHQIADSTLAQYDRVHIMSYDKTGPWRPEQPGPHSPYSMAVDDFTYFSTQRGIKPEKLSVGLPFYGYGFGAGLPSSIAFKNIALQYPQYLDSDSLQVTEGGWLFYNGKPSIRRKVEFARDKGAFGVMIWQLAGDAKAPHSLLDVINRTLQQ